MKKNGKRKQSNLRSVTDLTKNLTRGLVGAAKSRAYQPNGDDKSVRFKAGTKRALLFAGRELPVQFFDTFLDWTFKQIEQVSPAQKFITPTAYTLLSGFYDTAPIDFDRQITWSLKLLQANSAKLLAFEETMHQLQQHVLYGNGDAARKLILKIEQDFGPSVRLLEAKLAVEQFYFGLESQKRFADEMRGKRKSGLIGLIIYYVSMRNEPSMPLKRFHELVNTRVKAMQAGPMREYVSYRLAGKFPTNTNDAAGILRIEESHSIFDLADTLRRFAIQWSMGEWPAEIGHWLPLIDSVLKSAVIKHATYGNDASDAQILARSIFTGETSIKTAYIKLSRERTSPPMQLACLQILAFCASVLRTDPNKFIVKKSLLKSMEFHLAVNILAIPSIIGVRNEIEKVAINFSTFELPSRISEAFNAGALNLLSPWQRIYDKTPVPFYGLKLSDITNEETPEEIYTIYQANSLFIKWLQVLERDQSYSTLSRFVSFAKSFKQNFPRAIAVNVRLALAHVLAELGEDKELLQLTSELAVNYEVDNDLLQLESALRGKKWRQLQSFSNEIYLSIALTLLSRSASDESLETLKRYALEDFLTACGARKPSELAYQNLNISTKELIYFFRFVCTQRTMELLSALKGSMALESERQAICTILIHLDKENASLHNEELVGIIHRARIAEGLRLVDSSRVHVDVDMLKKQLINILDTDFKRYKSLVAVGVGVSKNIEQVLRGISKSAIEEEWLRVPESEADDLLIQIIQKISEDFLNDKLYGLDSYLGRRIRHNSLTGQMRDPLGEEKLITQYDDSIGGYVDNEYWLNRLASISVEDRDAVGQMLNIFSSKFDEIGRKLCSKYLHIRSPEFPDGLFELPIEAPMYHVFRSYAQTKHTLNDFIMNCFSGFWVTLTPRLARAQRLITIQTRNEITQCFDELQAGLAKLQSCGSLVDLTAAVSNAQRAVSRKLEQIGEWFSRSEHDISMVSYSIEDAVNISIEACLISHRAKNPNIKMNSIGDSTVDAGTLFALADIFWVAIDNACTHSGIPHGVEISVDVQCLGNDGALQIHIVNKISPSAKSRGAIDKVNGIRDDIEKRRLQEGLKVEGKSGIKKIAAMVYSAQNGKLEFGYSEPSTFILHVEIPMISIESNDEVEESIIAESHDECAAS